MAALKFSSSSHLSSSLSQYDFIQPSFPVWCPFLLHQTVRAPPAATAVVLQGATLMHDWLHCYEPTKASFSAALPPATCKCCACSINTGQDYLKNLLKRIRHFYQFICDAVPAATLVLFSISAVSECLADNNTLKGKTMDVCERLSGDCSLFYQKDKTLHLNIKGEKRNGRENHRDLL